MTNYLLIILACAILVILSYIGMKLFYYLLITVIFFIGVLFGKYKVKNFDTEVGSLKNWMLDFSDFTNGSHNHRYHSSSHSSHGFGGGSSRGGGGGRNF